MERPIRIIPVVGCSYRSRPFSWDWVSMVSSFSAVLTFYTISYKFLPLPKDTQSHLLCRSTSRLHVAIRPIELRLVMIHPIRAYPSWTKPMLEPNQKSTQGRMEVAYWSNVLLQFSQKIWNNFYHVLKYGVIGCCVILIHGILPLYPLILNLGTI